MNANDLFSLTGERTNHRASVEAEKDMGNRTRSLEKRRRKRENDAISKLKAMILIMNPNTTLKLEKADILEKVIEILESMQHMANRTMEENERLKKQVEQLEKRLEEKDEVDVVGGTTPPPTVATSSTCETPSVSSLPSLAPPPYSLLTPDNDKRISGGPSPAQLNMSAQSDVGGVISPPSMLSEQLMAQAMLLNFMYVQQQQAAILQQASLAAYATPPMYPCTPATARPASPTTNEPPKKRKYTRRVPPATFSPAPTVPASDFTRPSSSSTDYSPPDNVHDFAQQ